MLLLSSLFFSCSDSDNGASTDSQKAEANLPSTENPASIPSATVSFKNNSSYSVNIFKNSHRNSGGSMLLTVEPKATASLTMLPSANESGDAFYFEYNILLGDILFPYFSYENSKAYLISTEKKNVITIDELSSCPTKSAYIVMENKSTSPLYLVYGSSILTPLEMNSYLVDSGESAVYLAGENDEPIYYENSSLLKLVLGTKTIFLPDISFALGNVYTFTVTNDSCTLKSVSPFDLDTQRQIWSFDDGHFLCDGKNRTVMRSQQKGQGFLIAGTVTASLTSSANPVYIGVKKIDFYGNQSDLLSAQFTHKSGITLTQSRLLDFVELSDGSIVLLLENHWLEDGEEKCTHLLVRYDFEKQTLYWSKIFNYSMLFRLDTRNFLIRTDDDEVILVGGLLDSSGMHEYAAKFSSDGSISSEYVSDSASDFWENGAESMFTSAYYDGKNLYVCGYENCDFQYDSRIHRGIVCKFSTDMNQCEKIYDKEKCIFTCIAGKTSDFYICGEITENGNIQKGCFASSLMIEQDEEPESCTIQTKPYSWFNQLCFYDEMIVLCGTASEDQSGGKNPVSIVAAFGKDGKQLWENTGAASYKNALSVIPNNIGTYIIQMEASQGSAIHYASADLQGKTK